MGLFGGARDAAENRLNGTHKVHHNCCGGTGKHLGGCDGKVHDFYKGVSHSGETTMSNAEMDKFKKNGGSFHSARPNGDGKYIVHIKKMPKR